MTEPVHFALVRIVGEEGVRVNTGRCGLRDPPWWTINEALVTCPKCRK